MMAVDSNPPRIIRTMVYMGAHDEDFILRSVDMGMDAICLDFEDSTPVEELDTARSSFRNLASKLVSLGVVVMARTNPVFGGGAEADLDALVCPELHCVQIPKANNAAIVEEYCTVVDRVEAAHGLPAGYTLVRPIIETAQAVRLAYEIAAASDRIAYAGGVQGGFWGDLATGLGYFPSVDGIETLWLRSKILVDVRAAGVPFPIGGGTAGATDIDNVRSFALQNRHLGYTGSHCRGEPAIVAAVNEAFTPTRTELDEWLPVLDRLSEAEQKGETSVFTGKHQNDLINVARLRPYVDLARRVGLLDT
jgi:citrate lyase subunit beta/citryl-CoA lyase